MSIAKSFAIAVFTTIASFASAHEVWLEPLQWEVPDEAIVQARLLNGEGFKGAELLWDPRVIVRAQRWQGDDGADIAGRFGDNPALATNAAETGLLTLVYQSAPNTVVYESYDKFALFVAEKGFDTALADHAVRDLPRAPIKEAFSRHVKTLMAVGDGRGADVPRGLEIEIVALTNPYTADPAQPMQFQALYQSAPLADHLVTLFERTPEGEVNVQSVRSDATGIASFVTKAGNTYLVDAVVLRVPARDLVLQTRGAVWESLWASLTFRVPYRQ